MCTFIGRNPTGVIDRGGSYFVIGPFLYGLYSFYRGSFYRRGARGLGCEPVSMFIVGELLVVVESVPSWALFFFFLAYVVVRKQVSGSV